MEYPRKREAEEEVGKQKKLVKLAHKSDASDAEKTNAAHASWQQQPAMGAGFKFSSYVKVKGQTSMKVLQDIFIL